jgi:tRNA1(Val) A37 N6-methylase TrmN6
MRRDASQCDPQGAAFAGEPAKTVDAFLGGAVEIEQPAKGYRAGLDAVLLAAAVPASASDRARPLRVLDVGGGVGTAGLCLATRLENVTVTLLERDPHLSRLAGANIARNGLAQRARAVTADALAPAQRMALPGLPEATFDIAISNPPYLTEGRHRPSANDLKAAAHGMPPDGLDRWLRFMARMTRPGGAAFVIHRADCLETLLAAFSRRFGDLSLTPLHPRRAAPASRVLVRGIKASRAPLSLAPGRVLHGADGSFTPEIKQVLSAPVALDWSPAE